MNYNELTQEQINGPFLQACTQGQLDLVKYLVSSPELKNKAEFSCEQGKGLVQACKHGHHQVVDYLLNSPDTKTNPLTYQQQTVRSFEAFLHACALGDISTIKLIKEIINLESNKSLLAGILKASIYHKVQAVDYLLSLDKDKDSALKKELFSQCCAWDDLHMVRHFIENYPPLSQWEDTRLSGLKAACEHGSQKILQYLTTPDKQVAIGDYNSCIIVACENGRLPVLKQLLEQEHLQPYINIHARKDSALIQAFQKGHVKVMEYLIFEYKIALSSSLKDYLEVKPEEKIELKTLFEKRSLQQNLNDNLPEQPCSKSIRVKL